MNETARELLDQIISSSEYEIVYDLYDKGGASADAIQDALENLQRLIDSSIEMIKEQRS